MRRLALVPCAAMVLALAPGCAQNPYALKAQLATQSQQQLALQERNKELARRTEALDQDNLELQTLLSQTQQRGQVLQDELAAVREQLSGTVGQLARLRDELDTTEEQARTRAASTRRNGASISTNNSLADQLPTIDLPDVETRVDGDVIRIELPAARLFSSGGATLAPDAGRMIETVADELARAFPNHIIGIEGHTDSDPVRSSRFASNHQLSVARAMAVYDYLASRSRLQPGQLFVVGHGANHPVVSNATPAGKERNRRVELVVYPESLGG